MKVGDPNGSYAEVIEHSVSPAGAEIVTLEVQTWRFVLAEFNTHRAFSRNSASSRAIPLAKQLEKVLHNPAVPISFPAEQKGMQGGEELADRDLEYAHTIWINAAMAAMNNADEMGRLGVHKSICNRLLEPFMWHRMIITTDTMGLGNFFEQRCSPLAQPEIRQTAEQMRAALAQSVPVKRTYREWHTPYVTQEDYVDLVAAGLTELDARKISAARCARVSYLTHEGVRSLQADLTLFDRLATAEPPHWSPMEHQARPRQGNGEAHLGNLQGWRQYRHEVML